MSQESRTKAEDSVSAHIRITPRFNDHVLCCLAMQQSTCVCTVQHRIIASINPSSASAWDSVTSVLCDDSRWSLFRSMRVATGPRIACLQFACQLEQSTSASLSQAARCVLLLFHSSTRPKRARRINKHNPLCNTSHYDHSTTHKFHYIFTSVSSCDDRVQTLFPPHTARGLPYQLDSTHTNSSQVSISRSVPMFIGPKGSKSRDS